MSDVAQGEASPGAEARTARSGASGRRRLLTAGLSGAALAALVARPASASAGTEAPADSAAPGDTEAPATTAAPRRPTDNDTAQLVRLQAIELAALALYQQTLASGVFVGDRLPAIATIASDHDAYAEALGALLGTKGIHTADPAIVEEWSDGFSGPDPVVVAQNARSFEQALAATYIQLLGEIEGTDATGLLASIAPIVARHATVLAEIAGLDPAVDLDSFAGAIEATSLLTES